MLPNEVEKCPALRVWGWQVSVGWVRRGTLLKERGLLRGEVGCWLGGCSKPAFFPNPSEVGQIRYLKFLSHNHGPLLTMLNFIWVIS